MRLANPRVGLLNIGEEESKGATWLSPRTGFWKGSRLELRRQRRGAATSSRTRRPCRHGWISRGTWR